MNQAVRPDPSVKHPEFAEHFKGVDTCYDAFYADVREEEYIPRLQDQTDAEYEAYVSRPPFLNATERTVQALIGVMMRNPIEAEGDLESVMVDGSENFEAFVQDNYMDMLLGSRIMLMVDVGDDGLPYLCYYPTENIINWGPTFVVLEVCDHVRDPKNPFNQIERTRWKELFLADPELHAGLEEGKFYARYWEKRGKVFVPGEPVQMLVRGTAIDFLPTYWVTPYDNTEELYNPPLQAIAELNVAHIRLGADLYHGLHFLALPTFTVVGNLATDANGNADTNIRMGSTKKALHLSEGGSASFVEFSGTGLAAIKETQTTLEEQMQTLGARLVSPKAGVETAEAMQIRAAAETSVLETMVNALESGLNAALTLYAEIAGSTPVAIKLNKNFTENIDTVPEPTADQMATVMVMGDKGLISSADVVAEAKRRGVVSPDVVGQERTAPVTAPGQPRQVGGSL